MISNIRKNLNSFASKPYAYSISFPLTSGQQSFSDTLQLDGNSYFLVESIQAVHSFTQSGVLVTENVFIQISDTTRGQPWSNVPINISDLAGLGPMPKKLKSPTLLYPNTVLSVNGYRTPASFTVTGDATIYIVFYGRKIESSLVPLGLAETLKNQMFFQYALQVPDMAANAVAQTETIQLFNDSKFYCQTLLGSMLHRYQSLILAQHRITASELVNDVLFNLRDQGKNYNFFNQKLSARLVLGSGPLPAQYPVFLKPGSTWFQEPVVMERNAILLGEFDNPSNVSMDPLVNTDLIGFYPFHVVLEGIREFV